MKDRDIEAAAAESSRTVFLHTQAAAGLYEQLACVADMLRACPALPEVPAIVYRDPAGVVRAVPIAGEWTAGRESPSTLVLADSRVSRRHLRIWIEGGAAVLEDAGSRNGTFVNGVRTARRELRSGDVIELGNQLLVYVEPT